MPDVCTSIQMTDDEDFIFVTGYCGIVFVYNKAIICHLYFYQFNCFKMQAFIHPGWNALMLTTFQWNLRGAWILKSSGLQWCRKASTQWADIYQKLK